MRIPRSILAAAAFMCCDALHLVAQSSREGMTMCVVPPADSTWRPLNWGFEIQGSATRTSAGVLRRSYPVVLKVIPNSRADSAGLREGDTLVAINGRDLKQEARGPYPQPNVPARLSLRRDAIPFEAVVTPTEGRPCAPARRK